MDTDSATKEASPASNNSRASNGSSTTQWTAVNTGRPRPQRNSTPRDSASQDQAAAGPAGNGTGGAPIANGHGSSGNVSEGSANSQRRPVPRNSQRRRYDQPRQGAVAPRDMDELRMHIDQARAGTGEVESLIRNSSFQPREAAFTRLIQQCVPHQDWQKALELWQVMRATKELKPNTITYSVLIHVCATVGRWQEAESIFDQQLQATKVDEDCAPNRITYSSLLTACVRGKQVERALHWYDHMTQAGIEADTITYSVLIPACLEHGVPLPRVLALVEEMHAAGHNAGPETYCRIMHTLGSQGRWQQAVEVFISAQMAGVAATQELCLAMLGVLEACEQATPAAQMLQEFSQAFGAPQPKVCLAALRVYAKSGAVTEALALWETWLKQQPPKNQETAALRLLVEIAEKAGRPETVAALKADFQSLGLQADSPAPQKSA